MRFPPGRLLACTAGPCGPLDASLSASKGGGRSYELAGGRARTQEAQSTGTFALPSALRAEALVGDGAEVGALEVHLKMRRQLQDRAAAILPHSCQAFLLAHPGLGARRDAEALVHAAQGHAVNSVRAGDQQEAALQLLDAHHAATTEAAREEDEDGARGNALLPGSVGNTLASQRGADRQPSPPTTAAMAPRHPLGWYLRRLSNCDGDWG